MDQLPDYMKISYKALLDVYEEMKQLLPEEREYRVEYARKAVRTLTVLKPYDHQQINAQFGLIIY